MSLYFVEDRAHDAILKILNFPGPEIRICNGRSKTISLALENEKKIALIDRDNSISHPKIQDAVWKQEDDFSYSVVEESVIICFSKNVEDWVARIASALNLKASDFNLPQDLHGRINSNNHDARRFLEKLRDSNSSPLIMLRNLIRSLR